MKRKTSSMIAVLLLAACLLALPAQAAVPSPVAPCFEDIHLLSAMVDISDSGLASANAYVSTATSTHKIYLNVYLQQQTDGIWSTLTSGTGSGSGYVSKTITRYVTHGHYYRTRAVVTVYTASGALVESASINSSSQYY